MKKMFLLFMALNFFVGCYDSIDPKAPRESNARKWTDGIVYYKWHNDMAERYRNVIIDCMINFEEISSLQFIEDDTQEYFVTIKRGDKNSVSSTGMHRNLIMTLYNANDKKTIKHELGHVIGLHHEHQTENRDNHIEILWRNIPENKYFNFVVVKNDLIPENIFPYDKSSFMHYRDNQFSKSNKKSMISINGYHIGFLSDGDNFFTDKDIEKIQYLYP